MKGSQKPATTSPTSPTVGTDLESQSLKTVPELNRVQSHYSNHDMHAVSSYVEVGDEVYDRFTPQRKNIIIAILSLCGFLAPIGSTMILSAIPEVAAQFDTTGTIINVSNALYMLTMGISPCFYGPLSQIYGRKWVCLLVQR